MLMLETRDNLQLCSKKIPITIKITINFKKIKNNYKYNLFAISFQLLFNYFSVLYYKVKKMT
jgi:hypothetical protein